LDVKCVVLIVVLMFFGVVVILVINVKWGNVPSFLAIRTNVFLV
jgi:hypothetical protein